MAEKIKENLSIILIVVIFVIGAMIFVYPSVANWLYEKNGSKAIMEHNENIEQMTPEQISSERKAVIRYNKSLVDNSVVLTDPFDPDAFPITDGRYDELLADDEMMGYVEIPCIDVKLPIFHGTSEEVLEKGAGHLENTSLPMGGKDTHTVISAHSGFPTARLFTDLSAVKKGDIFRIYVLDEILTYEVYKIDTVKPENTSSLMIEKGKDLATLVTCTPYGKNTHRLLVHGRRTKTVITDETEGKSQSSIMEWERIATIAATIIALIFVIIILMSLLRRLRRKLERRRR